MGFFSTNITPELYDRYKKQVLEMSPAIQYFDGVTVRRENSCLTDQEIADRLGLDVDVVTEIRCIAELDLLPVDAWKQAEAWRKARYEKAFPAKKKKGD